MGESRAAMSRGERSGGGEGPPSKGAGLPAAPGELDDLIHQRIRLGIMGALAATDRISFSDLKGLLETTDGNLSVHARKLEDAGYVECIKSFVDRVPLTEYRLTPEGRAAFERYIEQMEALFERSRRSGQ